MSKIIKIIDERETQKQKNTKRQKKGGANMRLIFFDMFFNPRFKMTTRAANIARTRASTSKFIY